MDNKKMVKYFYENIVSKNDLDELSKFISEDCILRIGESVTTIGLKGMKKHLIEVKKTYPDYTMKIIEHGGATNTFETLFENNIIKGI